MTEEEIVRWARYYAVLTERFPLDIYEEQTVRPRRVAKRRDRLYGSNRQPAKVARKGINVY